MPPAPACRTTLCRRWSDAWGECEGAASGAARRGQNRMPPCIIRSRSLAGREWSCS